MTIAKFQVSTRASGRRRTVQVRAYDNAEELRRAARRYWRVAACDLADAVSDDTVGLCQAYESIRYDGDEETVLPDAGFIRLSRHYLGSGVISHECTHMALAIFHQDVTRRAIRNMATEEKLCYLVSDLVNAVVDGLYRHGVYD